jgi:hypothetical protein
MEVHGKASRFNILKLFATLVSKFAYLENKHKKKKKYTKNSPKDHLTLLSLSVPLSLTISRGSVNTDFYWYC